MALNVVKTLFPVAHENDPAWLDPEFEPICECCPLGRSGHRIVATDNSIYALGGFNPALGAPLETVISFRGHPCLFKELWKFNLSTHKWLLIDDFYSVPPTIASHTIAILGRWLFLFGGTAIPFGETPSSSLYRYDLLARPSVPPHAQGGDENARQRLRRDELVGVPSNSGNSRWRLIPVEGEVPDERYGHTMTMKFPDVYIVGGTSGYIYNVDVYHLDLSAFVGKWTKLSTDGDPKQPVGRYRHETAFDGEILYIFGGGTDRDAFSLKIVHTFDVKKRSWGTLKTLPDPVYGFPAPRKCHSCCQYENDVFMVGGVSGTSETNRTHSFNDIWRFSLAHGTWLKFTSTIPRPVYFHSAEILPRKGVLVIFGGVTKMREHIVRTKRLVSVRVAVGVLQELAWDVVASCLRPRWDRVDLNDLGIPQVFQSRVVD